MENNIIHIFYIKQTEELADAVFQQFLLQLPDSFQQEINRYKHRESAQASLMGKTVLQYGLQYLNLNYTLYDIQIGAKERPFLNNEIDINISHSGEYIIAAISVNAKVGIDIEKHRNVNVDLFRKYFDDFEWKIIQEGKDVQQSFFDLWSIKESAIKCDGRGVEILSQTHAAFTETKRDIDIIRVKCADRDFFCQLIDIKDKYSAAVCSDAVFECLFHQLQLPDLV